MAAAAKHSEQPRSPWLCCLKGFRPTIAVDIHLTTAFSSGEDEDFYCDSCPHYQHHPRVCKFVFAKITILASGDNCSCGYVNKFAIAKMSPSSQILALRHRHSATFP